MNNNLSDVVKQLVAPGKGLLAADESTKTIEKRLMAVGLQSTEEIRRKYRQMLFTTPGLEEFIGGVIMFDETVRQQADDGFAFPDYLTQKGIFPGIKVDGGLEPFNGSEEEVTKGLDGLAQRLDDYSKMGLKFTKWRGVIKISDIFPTEEFLNETLGRMAQFAKISQDKNFVPIVEPEILLDGNHTTARCEEISIKTWKILFEKLGELDVVLENLILKTSMVLPGKDSGVKAEPLEVANATLRALKLAVPQNVPAIVFLSGGQTPDEATKNLNEIVKLGNPPAGGAPWQLSFSFARALQDEAIKVWEGKDENVAAAQAIFYERAKKVSLARSGTLP